MCCWKCPAIPRRFALGFALLSTGGRASLLGIPSRPFELDFARDIIFKGAIVQGINGRKMFETWFQMEALARQASWTWSRPSPTGSS